MDDGSQDNSAAVPPALTPQNSGSAALRQEIAARVHRYRSRRSYRGPRYPSLRLKFESAEPSTSRISAGVPGTSPEAAARQGLTAEQATQSRTGRNLVPAEARGTQVPTGVKAREGLLREAIAKVIEFPRSNLAPTPLDELAEPVVDRPRILDVPEPAPSSPALGGILLGPMEEKEPELRPGVDVPLQSAALEQRLLASAIDSAVVLVASALFACLWFRITNIKPALTFSLAAIAAVSGFFWAAYQYLFIVHTGTTPGLKTAKLQLRRFDGTPPARPLRRWRVLVSLLSALSLGMGFFWCFLDEDALCWHDRMTRTYLAPQITSANLNSKPEL